MTLGNQQLALAGSLWLAATSAAAQDLAPQPPDPVFVLRLSALEQQRNQTDPETGDTALIATPPRALLATGIERSLDMKIVRTQRRVPINRLQRLPDEPALLPSQSTERHVDITSGRFEARNVSIDELTYFLRWHSPRPIIDETGLEARGPQVGGPLTLWHYHVWFRPKCLRGGLLSTGEGRNGCRDGEPSHRSPEMLHLWFLDHPMGRFATTM